MAANVTLQSLRDQVRARADVVNNGFVQDAELDLYINSGLKEFYDIITTKFEDYYLNPTPFAFSVTPPSGTALPSDFFKARGVDIQVSGDRWATATPYTFQERNKLQQPLVYAPNDAITICYRIMGGNIYMLNMGVSAPVVGQLWYIPVCPTLVNGTDTFDFINGWEEYVVIEAAKRIVDKLEQDSSALRADKAAMMKRIEDAAANRDVGTPERVTDVTYSYNGPFQRF